MARFSNLTMSLGSMGCPRRANLVSFGGFSFSRLRFVWIMARYSDDFTYFVSRHHFLIWVLYCFSLIPCKSGVRGRFAQTECLTWP
jgi:hypothetical protein